MTGNLRGMFPEDILELLTGGEDAMKKHIHAEIDSMSCAQCSSLSCRFIEEMEKLQVGDFGNTRPEAYLVFDKEDGEVNSDKPPKIDGRALCKDFNLSKKQLRTVLAVAMMAQAAEFAVEFKKMAAEKAKLESK
jgi:hypothetical protein|nr:MAG TPA: hypothetical protein [Caudoviricetes sp.]